MLTLDLKARFEELARLDHLQRIQALLTELDVRQQYALQQGFPGAISELIAQLDARGVRSAYQQACIVFSVMAGEVDVESIPAGLDAQAQLAQCVSRALLQGVPHGAFQHIHQVFAGVGVFNQAWIASETEADCSWALPTLAAQCTPIDLPCTHEGPVEANAQELINNQMTFFRTVSGFQHRVSAQFTPTQLLSQVCQSVLPRDPWVLSPVPVVEQCELGFGQGAGFVPVQGIDLVDARQAQLRFQQRRLDLPSQVGQGLESSWKASGLLHEASLRMHSPLILADLSFCAGWVKGASGFSFTTRGELRLSMPAGCLLWQGTLNHAGCLVQLGISLPQDFQMEWSLDEDFPAGQLPMDIPLLTRQQTTPLHVQLGAVVCVGKPVLNLANPVAGHLCLQCVARVDPETRRLGLFLALSHAGLTCHWLAVDALQGWSSGQWNLLPESSILSWDLLHG